VGWGDGDGRDLAGKRPTPERQGAAASSQRGGQRRAKAGEGRQRTIEQKREELARLEQSYEKRFGNSSEGTASASPDSGGEGGGGHAPAAGSMSRASAASRSGGSHMRFSTEQEQERAGWGGGGETPLDGWGDTGGSYSPGRVCH
jgi:hypothetical protein